MEEKDYVIISLKHTNFNVHPVSFVLWGSDYSGYTEDFEKAGRYSKSELEKMFGNNKNYKFVTEKVNGFLESELKDSIFVKSSDLQELGFKKKTVVTF